MRTTQIIPVEELSKAALLLDAVDRWAQVDSFVLHGPPQALDKDVVVAAPASIHADLDPVIPQHLGELLAGELRALIGIEDAGLAEPGERLAQRLGPEPMCSRSAAGAVAGRPTSPVGWPRGGWSASTFPPPRQLSLGGVMARRLPSSSVRATPRRCRLTGIGDQGSGDVVAIASALLDGV